MIGTPRISLPALWVAFVCCGTTGALAIPDSLSPVIRSVSAIAPQAQQTIVIKGKGFGTHVPYTALGTPYVEVRDTTQRWAAGRDAPSKVKGSSDPITLNVSLWTDTEIVITGFQGAYGMGQWRLAPGDHVEIAVWNARTGAGPATYGLTVGLGRGIAATKTSQSPTSNAGDRKGLTAQSQVHVPDDVIVQNVSNSLLANSALKTREILVTAQNGVVTLAGTVNSQMEKDAAERIAKSERGVRQVNNQLGVPPVVRSNGPSTSPAGATKRNILSVDFQNFDYASNCFGENGPAEVIHVSKGQANSQDEEFWADKPVYGDLKGDGQEEAVVVLSCHPSGMSPNVVSSEVFIFEMSESGPRVLAKLPSSYWKGERVAGAKVGNHQLAVDFLEMGDGSRACPEWIVTSKFRWNGNRFVNAGETRRKNSCSQ